MKKLGIIVPTYNRADILQSTIESIIKQILPRLDDVSLVVCDNASVDNTEEYMNRVVEEFPFVIYHRHESNKGYLYNFKYGIELSDAEYVFLHGDDDLMPPFFVSTILNYIQENPGIGLLHFNYFISDLDTSPYRTLYNHFDNNASCIYYETGKDFILKYFDLPSFMSSNVFRKELWMPYVDDPIQYECIAYEWLYVLYKGIEKSKCIFIPFPLFVQRISKSEGYPTRLAYFFIVGISRVFEKLGEDYYEKWKEYRKSYSKPKMFRNITSVYRDKSFYRKNYKLLNRYLDGFMYKSTLFLSLYIIPTPIEDILFNKIRKFFVG